MKVEFEYTEKTINEIIKGYYLDVICPVLITRENIAVALKHLYFYSGVSRSKAKDELKMLYRQMIILSYSTIEAAVISIAYSIQSKCRKCTKCEFRDVSMFKGDKEENERNAFYNADKFLRNIKILEMPYEDLQFYYNYRKLRNEIHLIGSRQILTNENYTDDFCSESMKFLKRFFKYLKDNYIRFKEETCKD